MPCKCLRALALVVASIVVVLFTSSICSAQAQRPQLSVEWIFSEQGASLAELPDFQWLADNTAILYDDRQPEGQRTFERFDPATRERHPAVDMAKAVASLKSLDSSADVKSALAWPEAFDPNGRQALYMFHGDIFLLDLS